MFQGLLIRRKVIKFSNRSNVQILLDSGFDALFGDLTQICSLRKVPLNHANVVSTVPLS